MNRGTATANKQRMMLEILGAKPIAFNPQLSRLCGSVKAGLFLSQLLYWFSRTDKEWIYKTIEEFESETSLTRKEQDSSITRLKQLGFIDVEVRGTPPTRNFRANIPKVTNAFVQKLQMQLSQRDKTYTENTTDIQSYRLNDIVKNDESLSLKLRKCTNPNGHNKGEENSCVTNLEDLQKEFGKKFTNFPAQIRAQHEIFRAGFTQRDIEKTANGLDKDGYWANEGWDMITISKKLSKGGKKYVN